eukprot:Rhum_TRINITY_DN14226_c12_g3::Rhum_TRINITY_DN14226_c12_g3_i1::g.75924::m.75924
MHDSAGAQGGKRRRQGRWRVGGTVGGGRCRRRSRRSGLSLEGRPVQAFHHVALRLGCVPLEGAPADPAVRVQGRRRRGSSRDRGGGGGDGPVLVQPGRSTTRLGVRRRARSARRGLVPVARRRLQRRKRRGSQRHQPAWPAPLLAGDEDGRERRGRRLHDGCRRHGLLRRLGLREPHVVSAGPDRGQQRRLVADEDRPLLDGANLFLFGGGLVNAPHERHDVRENGGVDGTVAGLRRGGLLLVRGCVERRGQVRREDGVALQRVCEQRAQGDEHVGAQRLPLVDHHLQPGSLLKLGNHREVPAVFRLDCQACLVQVRQALHLDHGAGIVAGVEDGAKTDQRAPRDPFVAVHLAAGRQRRRRRVRVACVAFSLDADLPVDVFCHLEEQVQVRCCAAIFVHSSDAAVLLGRDGGGGVVGALHKEGEHGLGRGDAAARGETGVCGHVHRRHGFRVSHACCYFCCCFPGSLDDERKGCVCPMKYRYC